MNLLDYGARWYDAGVARWTSLDPMAEEMPAWSPYNYTINNPVKLIDPDGRLPIVPVLLGLWALAESAMSAYDAYSTAKTIADPNATSGEKLAAGGGFVLGLFAPGGGYGNAAKQGLKMADNVGKKAAEIIVKVGGKEVDNINDFYKAAAKLDVNERVATYKQVGGELAEKNGWSKNSALSKKNGRDIYTDKKGNHYSLDTQHGRFEVLDKKGNHQKEIDFSGKQTKDADKKSNHNISL